MMRQMLLWAPQCYYSGLLTKLRLLSHAQEQQQEKWDVMICIAPLADSGPSAVQLPLHLQPSMLDSCLETKVGVA